MFKKLLAVGVVVLIAAMLAIPAFAQTTSADLNIPYGSEDWLAQQFGNDPNFCSTIAQNPDVQAQWVNMYGDAIKSYCGWS